jgi:hypothetical protein
MAKKKPQLVGRTEKSEPLNAPTSNLALQVLASHSKQLSRADTDKIIRLVQQFADIKVEDIEAIGIIAKVKKVVQGKPGFQIVGGCAGATLDLRALEILLSEKINAQ